MSRPTQTKNRRAHLVLVHCEASPVRLVAADESRPTRVVRCEVQGCRATTVVEENPAAAPWRCHRHTDPGWSPTAKAAA